MNKKISVLILFLFLISVIPMNVFSAGDDLDNYEVDGNYFIIDEEDINLQRSQSEQETQILNKEGEYRLKLYTRQSEINNIFSTYGVTFKILFDLLIQIILALFIMLVSYFLVEYIPNLLIKFLDIMEGWFK